MLSRAERKSRYSSVFWGRGCGGGLRWRVGLLSRSMGAVSMISWLEEDGVREEVGIGSDFMVVDLEVSFWSSRCIRLESTVFSRFT
jgi:hypothetical protein